MKTSNPMLKKNAFHKKQTNTSTMTIGETLEKHSLCLSYFLQRLSIHIYR